MVWRDFCNEPKLRRADLLSGESSAEAEKDKKNPADLGGRDPPRPIPGTFLWRREKLSGRDMFALANATS